MALIVDEEALRKNRALTLLDSAIRLRIPSFFFLVIILAVYALWRVGMNPRNQYEGELARACEARYDLARTLADSSAVDQEKPSVDLDSAGIQLSCGQLRARRAIR